MKMTKGESEKEDMWPYILSDDILIIVIMRTNSN